MTDARWHLHARAFEPRRVPMPLPAAPRGHDFVNQSAGHEEADMVRVCGRSVVPRHVASVGFVLALMLFGADRAAAQAVYGSIAGTVTD